MPLAFPIFSKHLGEFLCLFVIRIVKTNSSQFPSKIELLFLFCPFLLFSILSGFTYFRPYFWPYMIWSGSLNVCQSPPGPHSFGNFCFNEVKFVNPFHECDTCLFEETLQQSSICFNCMTQYRQYISVEKCFSPRHVQLNTKFSEMTIDGVSRLGSTRSRHGLQRHLFILSVETSP